MNYITYGMNLLATAVIDQAIIDIKSYVYYIYKAKNKAKSLELEYEIVPIYNEKYDYEKLKEIYKKISNYETISVDRFKSSLNKLKKDQTNIKLINKANIDLSTALANIRKSLRVKISSNAYKIEYLEGQLKDILEWTQYEEFETLCSFPRQEGERLFKELIMKERLKYAQE